MKRSTYNACWLHLIIVGWWKINVTFEGSENSFGALVVLVEVITFPCFYYVQWVVSIWRFDFRDYLNGIEPSMTHNLISILFSSSFFIHVLLSFSAIKFLFCWNCTVDSHSFWPCACLFSFLSLFNLSWTLYQLYTYMSLC